ncbi:MAG: AAA family ATPase, partial [Myxococcota bacterium]
MPGYHVEAAGRRVRHVVDTPLPFADPATWQRLRVVIDTVGRWTASVIEIGGRRCWPLWRGVHDVEAVLTCFHRRPAGARGADYCRGTPTPTADATTWGCRFVRGVDLEAWGQSHAPWYHFGQLTADHTRFVVDKRAITETLHHVSRDRACRWCPAFAWPAVDAVVAALPDDVAVSPDSGYALRYGERDPARPVGITRMDPDRDLAVSVRVPLEGEDEDAAVPRHVPTVRYADVAGQAAAVQAVRDVCELPLTHGAYFAALGLAPPRGVILYGPPGNGKTLLAQAVATETAAHLEIVSGPEILSQWVGGSEAQLRQVFARARAHHPAVILIDELDALASRRDGAGPPHHAQLVAQLLV